jgi:hypothetical protein
MSCGLGMRMAHIYRAKTLGGYRGSSVKSELSARDAWTGGNLSTRLGQVAPAGAVLRRSIAPIFGDRDPASDLLSFFAA